MEKIFRGHLDECIEHFKQCFDTHFPKGLSGVEKARKPVADFCRVGTFTVKRWLETGYVRAPAKFKLMCWLDLQGYSIIELSDYKNIEAIELIGYSVVDSEEMYKALGYAREQNLFNILSKSEISTKSPKYFKLREFLKKNRAKLKCKKEEAIKYKVQFSLDEEDQRKSSSIAHLMEAILILLEIERCDNESFLQNLSASEKKTLMKLADVFREMTVKLVKK